MSWGPDVHCPLDWMQRQHIRPCGIKRPSKSRGWSCDQKWFLAIPVATQSLDTEGTFQEPRQRRSLGLLNALHARKLMKSASIRLTAKTQMIDIGGMLRLMILKGSVSTVLLATTSCVAQMGCNDLLTMALASQVTQVQRLFKSPNRTPLL